MTQQTVHWAEELATLRRIHLRQALRERPLVLVSLPIIVLLGFVLPAWRNFFWLGALVVLLIVLLGTWLQLQWLSQAARAGGKTDFQLGAVRFTLPNGPVKNGLLLNRRQP